LKEIIEDTQNEAFYGASFDRGLSKNHKMGNFILKMYSHKVFDRQIAVIIFPFSCGLKKKY
jgi:hypothetical protein